MPFAKSGYSVCNTKTQHNAQPEPKHTIQILLLRHETLLQASTSWPDRRLISCGLLKYCHRCHVARTRTMHGMGAHTGCERACMVLPLAVAASLHHPTHSAPPSLLFRLLPFSQAPRRRKLQPTSRATGPWLILMCLLHARCSKVKSLSGPLALPSALCSVCLSCFMLN